MQHCIFTSRKEEKRHVHVYVAECETVGQFIQSLAYDTLSVPSTGCWILSRRSHNMYIHTYMYQSCSVPLVCTTSLQQISPRLLRYIHTYHPFSLIYTWIVSSLSQSYVMPTCFFKYFICMLDWSIMNTCGHLRVLVNGTAHTVQLWCLCQQEKLSGLDVSSFVCLHVLTIERGTETYMLQHCTVMLKLNYWGGGGIKTWYRPNYRKMYRNKYASTL